MVTMQFDYARIEPLVHKALYDTLGPHIAVGTEEVDDGRVFVKVVSPQLNGKSEREKQDIVWEALNALKENKQAVSMALAFGTDEI